MGYRNEEKETILNYSFTDKMWEAWTNIPSHIQRMEKRGWKMTRKTEIDGVIVDAAFTVPKNAITFRNLLKKDASETLKKTAVSDDFFEDDKSIEEE